MVRHLAPFLIALACFSAAPAPAVAQGNCPQCDLPPQCRGNAHGRPWDRPECQPPSDDEDEDEEEDDEEDDEGDDDEDEPGDDTPPAPPPCVNCEGLPRKCRNPEEYKDLPAQVRRKCRPVEIIVESDIDFGRVVLLKQGSGSVMIDLETGDKLIEGDIEDIGGVTITGEVSVSGTPLEAVEIDFPFSVGMRDGTAQQAEVRQFKTDLPAFPVLDTDGELRFRFTGKLMLDASSTASGRLRGRVPISVSYSR